MLGSGEVFVARDTICVLSVPGRLTKSSNPGALQDAGYVAHRIARLHNPGAQWVGSHFYMHNFSCKKGKGHL